MYFDKPGKENTEQTLKLAFQKGQQLGINEVVVASTTGDTAYKALEISIMATDAGALSGKDIIAVGGTAKGADCAVVLKPVCQSDFFDMRIREIICKPKTF